MKAVPYVALALIGIVAVVAGAWYIYRVTLELIQHHKQQRLEDADHETMWTAYARPDPNGDWDIGVERFHSINGGTTFEKHRTATLPADCADEQFVDTMTQATIRASRYNQNL